MLKKASIIFECSRIYSLPMTIMSWLVAFTFGLLQSGNVFYGIVALFGISFAHMAANVFDDYFDYKSLIKQVNFNKIEYLKNVQKTKCRSLVAGILKESDVLLIAILYLFLACLCGLLLFIKTGMPVLYIASVAGVITLSYSFLSRIKLSEFAVALTYGPLLYLGVYYVMTKMISPDIILLSLPTMFMTVILIFIHTVMDYNFDLTEGHQTLANSFDSQLDSLIILKILLILSYISPIMICIFDLSDWQVLTVYLTIPLAIDLYKSMVDYSTSPEMVPTKRWYHFPMENMKKIKAIGAESFMIRMYQSRNLMIYYSLLLAVSLIIASL